MTSLSSLGSSSGYPSIPEDSLEVPFTWFVDGVTLTADIRGRGSYGVVYVARWHGSKVAVKKLHEIFFESSVIPEAKRGILKLFARELNILFQLKHPNIVQFFGVYKASGRYTLELSSDTYLVQELMWGALDTRNRMNPKLNLRNIVEIMLGVTSALQYLHNRDEPIIHRDLASKNILLSFSGIPKIADLGVAKVIKDGHTTPQSRQPGTDLYMPPEVKIEGLLYDTKIDIFALGVILLEICIGHDVTAAEAFRMGSDGILKIVPEVERRKRDFQDLGNHILKPLIMKCLSRQDLRPTAKSIADHLTTVKEDSLYISMPELPILHVAADSRPTLNDETSKDLSARCEMLEEKVAVLLADKQHLERKLDSYMYSEQETESDQHYREMTRKQSQELEKQRAEILSLQKTIVQKEAEISQLQRMSSPPSSLTEPELRDQRATLLQKINQLQASSERQTAHLQQEIETLRAENTKLRLKTQQEEKQYTNGPSSLPSFPSYKSENIPSLSSLKVSGQGQPASADNATEMKKLKKLVEKYKQKNIELDMRLKDTRLELQQYESRQAGFDITSTADIERLRAENDRLHSQLHRALSDNNRLQQELSLCRKPY